MESLLPIAMFLMLLVGIAVGYPVALVMGGTAVLFILISDLPMAFLNLIITRVYANVLANWLLVAIPMFIYMGLVLEKSGVAERSLVSIQRLLYRLPGGLALSVLAIGVVLAAISGIVGASVVLLTMLALPEMQKRGYPDDLAAGTIAASGTLAILIPPSIMLIILADQLRVSIGAMFAAAIVPGLILVGLYALYAVTRLLLRPLPKEPVGAAPLTAREVTSLLLSLLPMVLLIVGVLGSIIAGIATPTEASGVGALAATLLALFQGRSSLPALWSASLSTARTTALVVLVMVGATCFAAVFRGVGGDALIKSTLGGIGAGPWQTLLIVLVVTFVLGFFLDWLEITLILMPIFGPIIAGLDFGNGLSGSPLLVWFGILIAVNLQTSFLTPPFGFSLFYMRGVARARLSNQAIYRGVSPMIALQLLTIGLIMLFPSLAV